MGQTFARFLKKKRIETILCDVHQINSEIHHLDITNLKEVNSFFTTKNVDTIINCAAYNDVDKAETEWKRAYLVNGIGTRNLGIISKLKEVKLVHYSTDYVFSGKKGTPYTIFDSPDPISKYGESMSRGGV